MGIHVPVAQLDRASVSEAEGLGFESQRARIFSRSDSYPDMALYTVRAYRSGLVDNFDSFIRIEVFSPD